MTVEIYFLNLFLVNKSVLKSQCGSLESLDNLQVGGSSLTQGAHVDVRPGFPRILSLSCRI